MMQVFFLKIIGSIIIIWDVLKDSKIKLITHKENVSGIMFSKDENYLFSVDGGLNPLLCIWAVPNLQLIYSIYLLKNPRSYTVKDTLLAYSELNNLLILLENRSPGYQISCWSFFNYELCLKFTTILDSEAPCNSIYFSGTSLCTSESYKIKLWDITGSKIKQIRIIPLSQQISVSCFTPLTNKFITLTKSGSVIILSEKVFTIIMIGKIH